MVTLIGRGSDCYKKYHKVEGKEDSIPMRPGPRSMLTTKKNNQVTSAIGRLKGQFANELAIQRAELLIIHWHGLSRAVPVLSSVTSKTDSEFTMTTVDGTCCCPPVRIILPGITHASRSRAFHRTRRRHHYLLESATSDQYFAVNLMPGNDRVLIENPKNSNCCTCGGKRRKRTIENYRSTKEGCTGNRRPRRYSQRDSVRNAIVSTSRKYTS